MYNQQGFYNEIKSFLSLYFDDKALLEQLLDYQKNIVKSPFSKGCTLHSDYDFFAYFSDVYNNAYKPLVKKATVISIDSSDTPSDLPEYAVRVIWYGRKGGQNIIKKVSYSD